MWISAGWWVSRVRFRLVDKNLMIRSYSLETRKESRHEMAGKWREQIVMLNVSCLSEWDFYLFIIWFCRTGDRRKESVGEKEGEKLSLSHRCVDGW